MEIPNPAIMLEYERRKKKLEEERKLAIARAERDVKKNADNALEEVRSNRRKIENAIKKAQIVGKDVEGSSSLIDMMGDRLIEVDAILASINQPEKNTPEELDTAKKQSLILRQDVDKSFASLKEKERTQNLFKIDKPKENSKRKAAKEPLKETTNTMSAGTTTDGGQNGSDSTKENDKPNEPVKTANETDEKQSAGKESTKDKPNEPVDHPGPKEGEQSVDKTSHKQGAKKKKIEKPDKADKVKSGSTQNTVASHRHGTRSRTNVTKPSKPETKDQDRKKGKSRKNLPRKKDVVRNNTRGKRQGDDKKNKTNNADKSEDDFGTPEAKKAKVDAEAKTADMKPASSTGSNAAADAETKKAHLQSLGVPLEQVLKDAPVEIFLENAPEMAEVLPLNLGPPNFTPEQAKDNNFLLHYLINQVSTLCQVTIQNTQMLENVDKKQNKTQDTLQLVLHQTGSPGPYDVNKVCEESEDEDEGGAAITADPLFKGEIKFTDSQTIEEALEDDTRRRRIMRICRKQMKVYKESYFARELLTLLLSPEYIADHHWHKPGSSDNEKLVPKCFEEFAFELADKMKRSTDGNPKAKINQKDMRRRFQRLFHNIDKKQKK